VAAPDDVAAGCGEALVSFSGTAFGAEPAAGLGTAFGAGFGSGFGTGFGTGFGAVFGAGAGAVFCSVFEFDLEGVPCAEACACNEEVVRIFSRALRKSLLFSSSDRDAPCCAVTFKTGRRMTAQRPKTKRMRGGTIPDSTKAGFSCKTGRKKTRCPKNMSLIKSIPLF
jgi:hypothetical protein